LYNSHREIAEGLAIAPILMVPGGYLEQTPCYYFEILNETDLIHRPGLACKNIDISKYMDWGAIESYSVYYKNGHPGYERIDSIHSPPPTVINFENHRLVRL